MPHLHGDETIHGLFRYAGMFGHPYNKKSSPHLFYRHRCYKCILDSLQRLLATRQAPSQSTGLPTRPGPPPVPDPNALAQHDAEQFVSWCLCIAWDKRQFGLVTLYPNSKTSVHYNLMAFYFVCLRLSRCLFDEEELIYVCFISILPVIVTMK